MNTKIGFAAAALVLLMGVAAQSQEIKGTVQSIDAARSQMIVHDEASDRDVTVSVSRQTTLRSPARKNVSLKELKPGVRVSVLNAVTAARVDIDESVDSASAANGSIVGEFWYNFRHNLFKPLLLFFYLGFLVPILRVKFEFPYVIYQGLTIYLLIAIGWHGGEELAGLSPDQFGAILGFMALGFVVNSMIGVIAYMLLSGFTKMRRVDKATVAGYYGSDSAGTFVTCLGVLATAHIAFDAYMPVMLAVMEIPGCLVALYLVSRLRAKGMDPVGNMPDEPGFDPYAVAPLASGVGDGENHGQPVQATMDPSQVEAIEQERELSLEKREHPTKFGPRPKGIFSPQLLHEVFLNPGLYLLFGGILIGFISRLQGPEVTRADDSFFVTLFQGVLCLFLLEMGMTASRKLRDLRTAGIGYIAFGLFAPNLFATIGILSAHLYSHLTGTPFALGTYVLFSVLCGAASYIAVPAVQRLAIPEASPTLPLAASLGLTFSYNVTIGIPVYIQIARIVQSNFPIAT
jgi:hypothetical protein